MQRQPLAAATAACEVLQLAPLQPGSQRQATSGSVAHRPWPEQVASAQARVLAAQYTSAWLRAYEAGAWLAGDELLVTGEAVVHEQGDEETRAGAGGRGRSQCRQMRDSGRQTFAILCEIRSHFRDFFKIKKKSVAFLRILENFGRIFAT